MLVHPKFDHILAGCTSLRLLELAQRSAGQGLLKGVEVRDIPVAEARASREMLLFGSSVKVAPIVQWDEQMIGDGKPGPVSKALLQLLDEDMRSERSADRRAILTAVRGWLIVGGIRVRLCLHSVALGSADWQRPHRRDEVEIQHDGCDRQRSCDDR